MSPIHRDGELRGSFVRYDIEHMKRRAFHVVVLLVLGAVINVAVAWTGAWIHMNSSHTFRTTWVATSERLGSSRGELTSVTLSVGYPRRCFYGQVESFYGGNIDGIWEVFPTAHLPLRVIWPGFVMNTVFYSAILWVVFFAPGTVKRMIRRRRGQCPACAYPIGTSPVCTECGAAVQARQSRVAS